MTRETVHKLLNPLEIAGRRFQGQTTKQLYIKRPPGAIQNPQATTST